MVMTSTASAVAPAHRYSFPVFNASFVHRSAAAALMNVCPFILLISNDKEWATWSATSING